MSADDIDAEFQSKLTLNSVPHLSRRNTALSHQGTKPYRVTCGSDGVGRVGPKAPPRVALLQWRSASRWLPSFAIKLTGKLGNHRRSVFATLAPPRQPVSGGGGMMCATARGCSHMAMPVDVRCATTSALCEASTLSRRQAFCPYLTTGTGCSNTHIDSMVLWAQCGLSRRHAHKDRRKSQHFARGKSATAASLSGVDMQGGSWKGTDAASSSR